MVSNEDLRRMLSEQVDNQSFGGERAKKLDDWLKNLQEGKTEELKNEIEKAKDTLDAMMEAKTPEDRKKLASDLRRQLQDLKKFSSDKANSKELANALEKALKSLEAAQSQAEKSESGEPSDELSAEAQEALKESLELAKAELDEMARDAQDMKKLEEALKTLQQAEKLNQQGQMDGEQCEGCKTLSDYAQMLKEMGAGQPGEGEGMGQKGFGKGGEAPEDGSDPEGYKDEKSKSQIKAASCSCQSSPASMPRRRTSIRTSFASTRTAWKPSNPAFRLRSNVNRFLRATSMVSKPTLISSTPTALLHKHRHRPPKLRPPKLRQLKHRHLLQRRELAAATDLAKIVS